MNLINELRHHITDSRRARVVRKIKAGSTVAVDFDGTLCECAYPGIGKPYLRFICALCERMPELILVLNTCREGDKLLDALRWCGEHDLYFDYANENTPELIKLFGGDCRKVSAHVYLDDKAVRI